jgi:hypothetical protein
MNSPTGEKGETMTLSELIRQLNHFLEQSGDMPVQFIADNGGWVSSIIGPPIIYVRRVEDVIANSAPVVPLMIGDVTIKDFFGDSEEALQIGFDITAHI